MKVRLVLMAFLLVTFTRSKAAVETIPSGSFLINMGITPQTIANGLKPYGLIYDLLKNQNVPIKWVINPGKTKDGVDFTHNSIDYKGGTFIVLQAYRTTAVNAVIALWQTKGVIGATSVSTFSAEVFMTLQFAPTWTLDKDNGNIVTDYFLNAEIPSSAYGGSSSSGWKTPAQLGGCDDIFVMPHADPTWATHSNLYYWNQTYKGNIWAACHAVSVMEAITNPGATIQMNFLSNTGLLNYNSHKDGTPPYSYYLNSDPVSQFMGTIDASTQNGSEQIFMPLLGGSWRGGTNIIADDPTQEDVPLKSPGPPSALVYGRAFNDPNRGYVMYEGGHDQTKGTVASQVAAQRAFFNYCFFVATSKSFININMDPVPGVMVIGTSYPVGFTLPPGYSASAFRIKWRSSCGGTFTPSDTIQNPTFTPPNNPALTSCVLSVEITDSCNRKNFNAKNVNLTIILLPLKLGELAGKRTTEGNLLQWETFYEDQHFEFTIEKSFDAISFSPVQVIPSESIGQGHQYAITDPNKYDRSVYYRVTVTDHSGRRYTSNSVRIYPEISMQENNYSISPNPAKEKITVRFLTALTKNNRLTLFDQNGITIFSRQVFNGTRELIIPGLTALHSGVYFLKLSDDESSSIKKLVIAR